MAAEYDILSLGIDARPAEEGARRYGRAIDDVSRKNAQAAESTDRLESRFRSLASGAVSGAQSLGKWILSHSLLLSAVGALSGGLSRLTSGAMAAFLRMSGRVAGILGDLTTHAVGFAAKGLRGLATALGGASASLGGLARGMNVGAGAMEKYAVVALRLTSLSTALVAAVSAVGVAIAAAASKAANEFAPAWNRVLTQLDDAHGQFFALRGEVSRLAASLGVEGTDAANTYYEALSAMPELTTQPRRALDLLRVALEAGTTGFTDSDTAMKAIVATLNAFGLQVERAEEVSDKLFKTQALGATTFGEIAQSIDKVSGLAASLGLAYEDVFAIVATITQKVGTPTNEVITALRQAIANTIKPTAMAAEEAKRLGIDFGAAALQAKGLNGFLLDLIQQTQGRPEVLSRFFGSDEALSLVISLAQNTDTLRQRVVDLGNATGEHRRNVEKMNDSWDAQKRILGEQMPGILRDLGFEFGSWGAQALKAINGVIFGLRGLDEEGRKIKVPPALQVWAQLGEAGVQQRQFLADMEAARQGAEATPSPSKGPGAGSLFLQITGARPVPARVAPDKPTLEGAQEQIGALSASLRQNAAIQLQATGNVAAYDEALRKADRSVNQLVTSKMKELRAAGVEESQVRSLATLYVDTYDKAREKLRKYLEELERTRKEMERLSLATDSYQARLQFTEEHGATALATRFRERSAAEEARRQQFVTLGGTLQTVNPGGVRSLYDEQRKAGEKFQTEQLKRFNETIEATRNVTSAFGELADALGGLDPVIATTLRGIETAVNGVGRYQAGQAQGGALGALGMLSGGLGVAAGVAQVVSGFLAESPEEQERKNVLRQNTDAILKLTRSFEGFGTRGDLTKGIGILDRLQGMNPLSVGFATTFARNKDFLTGLGDQYGVSVLDSKGKLVVSSLGQLDEALRKAAEMTFEFGDSLDQQKAKLSASNAIFGVTDPVKLVEQQFGLLQTNAPDLLKQAGLSNLNLGSSAGRNVALKGIQDLFTQYSNGTLDKSLLSGFTSGQEFVDLLVDAAKGLQGFNKELERATTDIPKAINLTLYERTFGTGVPGGSVGGGTGTVRPPIIGDPVGPPRINPTPRGGGDGGLNVHGDLYVTVRTDASESGEQAFKKIERTARRRAQQGVLTHLEGVS